MFKICFNPSSLFIGFNQKMVELQKALGIKGGNQKLKEDMLKIFGMTINGGKKEESISNFL